MNKTTSPRYSERAKKVLDQPSMYLVTWIVWIRSTTYSHLIGGQIWASVPGITVIRIRHYLLGVIQSGRPSAFQIIMPTHDWDGKCVAPYPRPVCHWQLYDRRLERVAGKRCDQAEDRKTWTSFWIVVNERLPAYVGMFIYSGGLRQKLGHCLTGPINQWPLTKTLLSNMANNAWMFSNIRY